MPVIVRQINKVHSATAFLENVFDLAGDKLYIGIGRDASNPWPNELAPPTPTNKKSEDNAFWADLKGIGKVSNTNDTTHGKQRVTWTSGIVYLPLSDTIDKSDVSSGNQFYVIASNNKVYSCISNNGGSPTGASGEPTLEIADETTADSYHWKFEYDAGAMAGWATLATLNWIPVESANAIQLGATYILAGLVFPDYAGTGDVIPNDEYRQIALLKNPQLSGGGDATLDWYAPASLENVGGDVSDGVVLTIDNRVKISRAEGQSETVVAILKF